jgi:hypothetical protein
MPYDTALADRIRAVLADRPAVREVAMFGGLSFLVDEKLTVAARGDGTLLVRCPAARADALLGEGVQRAEMNGRPMSKGWLVVGADRITGDGDLAHWIGLALDRTGGGT